MIIENALVDRALTQMVVLTWKIIIPVCCLWRMESTQCLLFASTWGLSQIIERKRQPLPLLSFDDYEPRLGHSVNRHFPFVLVKNCLFLVTQQHFEYIIDGNFEQTRPTIRASETANALSQKEQYRTLVDDLLYVT